MDCGLTRNVGAVLDCHTALDARDGDQEFVSNWMRVSDEIDRAWREAPMAEALQQLAEDTRRESFLTVSQATRQQEIASKVSVDFDLVVRERRLKRSDPFLGQLWQ